MSGEQRLSSGLFSNPRLLVGASIMVLMLIAVVAFAVAGRATRGQGLLPMLFTPTRSETADSSPAVLTFSELNANPLAYVDKPIQVSGQFALPQPRTCEPFSGPDIRWTLVSESLQLEVKGFERIVPLIEPETDMTVQGIWRLYQGPLGCGKGPPQGNAWYLQVQKILQPNPLIGGSGRGVNIENAESGFPSLFPTGTQTATPTATPTSPESAPAPTSTTGAILPAPTTTIGATNTAVFVTSPPLSTSTPAGTAAASPSASPAGSTTPGGSVTPSVTPSSSFPTATATTSGYPSPPTSTASPDPYS